MCYINWYAVGGTESRSKGNVQWRLDLEKEDDAVITNLQKKRSQSEELRDL